MQELKEVTVEAAIPISRSVVKLTSAIMSVVFVGLLAWITDINIRVRKLEIDVSAINTEQKNTDKTLSSMDNKLDILLRRVSK